MKPLLIAVINLYQHTLSPDHGPLARNHPGGYCRFQPTCSEYAKDAINEYGAIAGIFLSVARITRCHPWGPRGYDPIPK